MKSIHLIQEFFFMAAAMFFMIFYLPLAGMTQGAATKRAVFAGGCFWCMEKPFEALDGVISVTSGYTGGTTANPTYENYGGGGHVEAVEIVYDPAKISYQSFLDVFWRQIDPSDDGGQFADRGHAYGAAIFYDNDEEKDLALASKTALAATGIFTKPIVTPVLPAMPFYPAEDYHQDYYKNNPLRYQFYRAGSGRDVFLEKTWEKADEMLAKATQEELKKRLTQLQYRVTQEGGTEKPFTNEYWNNKEPGIYVDIVSGEPLFGSLDKYDSETGWPSFSGPLVADNIVAREDRSLFSVRTEVRSRKGRSHLGHVFDDGPPPSGNRYCINSAALRFIPVKDLEKEGYGQFLELFH